MKSKMLIVLIIALTSVFSVHASTITMSLSKESYSIGDTISITFSDAQGNENAWFAIYPAGDKNYESYGELEKVWVYANSGTETPGSTPLVEGSVSFSTEGLTPGDYMCTYFPNSSYDVGESVTFALVEESTTEPPESNPATSDISIFLAISFSCIASLVLLKRKDIVF